jgi:hypothetical protein
MFGASRNIRHSPRSLAGAAARFSMLAYLAVWLGAGSGIELLHVRIADHGHRYCAEHQQVEEDSLQGARADVRGTAGDLSRGDLPGVQAGARSTLQSHLACTFMNALSSRNPLSTAGHRCAPANHAAAVPAIVLPERIAASFATLLVAPKQSPPSSPC